MRSGSFAAIGWENAIVRDGVGDRAGPGVRGDGDAERGGQGERAVGQATRLAHGQGRVAGRGDDRRRGGRGVGLLDARRERAERGRGAQRQRQRGRDGAADVADDVLLLAAAATHVGGRELGATQPRRGGTAQQRLEALREVGEHAVDAQGEHARQVGVGVDGVRVHVQARGVRGVDVRLGDAAEGRADADPVLTHGLDAGGVQGPEEDQRQPRVHRVHLLQRISAEGLDQHLPVLDGALAQVVLVQQREELGLHVVLGIGRLGLDVVVDGLAVLLEDLLEGRDLLARPLGTEPLAGAAGLDLGEGLGVDGAGAVLGRTAHGAVQGPVVQHHEHTVAGDLQVLLDVVRAEGQGAVVGGERVLRPGAGGATMPDVQLDRRGLRGRSHGEGQQPEGQCLLHGREP